MSNFFSGSEEAVADIALKTIKRLEDRVSKLESQLAAACAGHAGALERVEELEKEVARWQAWYETSDHKRVEELGEAIGVLRDEHNELFAHVGQRKHSMEPMMIAMRKLFKVYAREVK